MTQTNQPPANPARFNPAGAGRAGGEPPCAYEAVRRTRATGCRTPVEGWRVAGMRVEAVARPTRPAGDRRRRARSAVRAAAGGTGAGARDYTGFLSSPRRFSGASWFRHPGCLMHVTATTSHPGHPARRLAVALCLRRAAASAALPAPARSSRGRASSREATEQCERHAMCGGPAFGASRSRQWRHHLAVRAFPSRLAASAVAEPQGRDRSAEPGQEKTHGPDLPRPGRGRPAGRGLPAAPGATTASARSSRAPTPPWRPRSRPCCAPARASRRSASPSTPPACACST